MSRIYTSGTANTRQAGAGRGGRSVTGASPGRGLETTGLRNLQQLGQSPAPSSSYDNAATPPNGTDNLQQEGSRVDRTMEYRGAYSVIPPDEKKRRAIQTQAQKETDNYEKYKQEHKPGRVSYVGTVGGDSTGSAEARARAVQSNANSKYARLQKQQQYREEKKRREEQEYQEKKDKARAQSESNTWKEQNRQQLLDADRRRKNEAFLRKLENQKKA